MSVYKRLGGRSADVEEFVGLEGEAPAWVAEDVVDDFRCVCAGAGLKKQMVGGDAVGYRLDILTGIHYLKFVTVCQNHFAAGFGGAGYPVDC